GVAADLGATLSRATIVRLKPRSQVGRHIDSGSYYFIRDRYHLVLQSPSGSLLSSGDEEVCMCAGELWWFDNKQHHSASNNSDDWRIHYIFDLLPQAHQRLAINPRSPTTRPEEPASDQDKDDAASRAQSRTEKIQALQHRSITDVLGEIIWLLSQSQRHKSLPMGELDRLVIAPVRL